MDIGPNVAFILKHPWKDIVYATTECINANGEILTLSLSTDGSMKLLDRRDARGRSTCYVNLDESCRFMTVINYWDAKVATFELSEAGMIVGECDMETMPGAEYVAEKNPDRVEHWQYRQRWPHTHCAKTEPYNNRRIFVCDLGRDKVLHYTLQSDGQLRCTGDVQMQKGLGPRHIEFHPTLRVAYITNELTSTVSVCRFSAEREKELDNGAPLYDDLEAENALLKQVQKLSTLPEDWQSKYFTNEHGIWKAASHSAEIRLHPSGAFLYIANRGHDSIACYVIDQETGLLTLSGICPSNGSCPRNFNVDVTGRWMIVGNQDSNNLSVFAVDQEKGTIELKHEVQCSSVNYVYTLPFEPHDSKCA
jgi:6-phosphogluconolactonase